MRRIHAIKNGPTSEGDIPKYSVILTDNGEFLRRDDIEMDVRGESKLFFCDPNRSYQKDEKNHTLIIFSQRN